MKINHILKFYFAGWSCDRKRKQLTSRCWRCSLYNGYTIKSYFTKLIKIKKLYKYVETLSILQM